MNHTPGTVEIILGQILHLDRMHRKILHEAFGVDNELADGIVLGKIWQFTPA